jgi:hypothetical protein
VCSRVELVCEKREIQSRREDGGNAYELFNLFLVR